MLELCLICLCLLCIPLLSNRPVTSAAATGTKEEVTELVRSFRAGNKAAFNRLVQLFQTRIFNMALNYTKSPEEAQDLTQDIFVTAFRAVHTLKEEEKFTSWLYQIAVNQCRNRYRRLQKKGFFSRLSLDDPDSTIQVATEETLDRDVERRNFINYVRGVIAGMAEAEREILVLRDVQGLSYEDISAALDIPIGTVKSKLNRARHNLKSKLADIL